MTSEMTEARHLRPGAEPRNERHPTQDAKNIVRRTPSNAHAELAALVERAQQLVEQIAGQAEADRREFEVAYRLGFETGVDVGRARAEREEQERDEALAEAVAKYSRTRTAEELQVLRYPTYTSEQLRKLRGRDRFPMNDRLCVHCDGRGYMPGGVA